MCGIIAYLTIKKKYNILNSIVQSLKTLQNRGYDSSGIGIYDKDTKSFITKKIVGNDLNQLLSFEKKISHFGMGHNRWSTHGEVNDINAHPHHSISKNFHIVHNGTIDNIDEIISTIPNYNKRRYSDTDTELFINLIEYYYETEKNVKKAINKTLKIVKGPFAICVFCLTHPNEVYFARRNLPLLIGFSENMVIASSESIGFYDEMEHYIELPNDNIFCSKIVDEKLINEDMNKYIKVRVVKSRELKDPYPFPFWTIKEIMEQPLTVQKSMNMGMRIKNNHEVILNGLNQKNQEILNCKKALLFGCGTSYHAGMIGNYLFKKMRCFDNSSCFLASEFDFDIDATNNFDKTLCLYLSQSGETKDLVDVLNITKTTKATNISIVNVVNSLIARTTGCGIYVNASRENGVASTKSFTAQVIVLALMSIWINQNKYNTEEAKNERMQMIKSLQDLPLDIEACFTLFYSIKLNILKHFTNMKKNSLFILGSGLGYYIAKEGALKIKEISYIHAEAYSLMDLKHGPFALIEEGTPIFVIAHDKLSHERSKNICSEIKTRKGLVIFISPYDKVDKCDYHIQVPYNPKFSFLLCLIPLQIIAYELTIARGYNPDFPRNLAKSVTVN